MVALVEVLSPLAPLEMLGNGLGGAFTIRGEKYVIGIAKFKF